MGGRIQTRSRKPTKKASQPHRFSGSKATGVSTLLGAVYRLPSANKLNVYLSLTLDRFSPNLGSQEWLPGMSAHSAPQYPQDPCSEADVPSTPTRARCLQC